MYKIGDKVFEADDPRIGEALAAMYGSSQRPLCMCRGGKGVEMYIAKLGRQYHIKRMPYSGASHAPTCESYEPPAELSGLGEVMGGAIQTNLADGLTTLKFGFALSKNGTRAAPSPSESEKDSVSTDGKKLTLRGTLHYLYDEAGLTRWSPAMHGKRSWWVVRKYLMQAAADKVAKGASVADLLFIPESFSLEKKDEIARRRQAVFNPLGQANGGARRLMLLIGEVKELGEARFGKKLVVKHMADAPFLMNEDIYKRLLKRFEHELSLWSGSDTSHLLVIATFGVSGAGVPAVEEASLMLTNEHWLPYETLDEKLLLDSLVEQKRRFAKGLRYNLPSSAPLASAVLSDTDEPVALYLTPFGATDEYRRQLHSLCEESTLNAWHWDAAEDMPALPLLGRTSGASKGVQA